ncbi:MAG: sensor histidine kinase [Sulfurovum sp.]|nr:sensor histidine kinase [Sulfurovum sp.]
MLNKKNYTSTKEQYLYGVLLIFILGAVFSAILRMYTQEYIITLIDAIALSIGYFIIRDYEKERHFSLTVIRLFWLSSIVIFTFIIYFQYSLHILLILLVPLTGSILLEHKDFLYHGAFFLGLFFLVMLYGFIHKSQYHYLNDTNFLVSFFLLFFFVLGLSLVYNQSIKKSYLELKKANEQKVFLLKEIHHRVKNNLNIVASILGLERLESDNKEVHKLINQNKLRIESIAMVHEILYKSDDLENINFKTYIQKLSEHILITESNHDNVNLDIDIVSLELSIESMIQFGIIINELMTNSIKYAFPDKTGVISIHLQKHEYEYKLIYKDNGAGMKEAQSGFGQNLIKMSVKQLKAELSIVYQKGLKYEITFKGDIA